MPTSTTNYGLIKPGTDDPILIGQINDNMDAIDTVLKDHSDKIDAAALGIKFKGEVNYYSNLPNDAEIGDAYTVKYAGSSGTTPDGTEYVWGAVSGVNQWINFSKDSYSKAEADALLALKQNALNSAQLAAVNSGINSEKVEQIETNKKNILSLYNQNGKTFNILDLNNIALKKSNIVCTVDNTIGRVIASCPSTTYQRIVWNIPTVRSIAYRLEFDVTAFNSAVMIYPTRGTDAAAVPYGQIDVATTGHYAMNFTQDVDTLYLGLYLATEPAKSNSITIDNMRITPMSAYNAGFDDFQPYAPSNAELYAMIQALQAQLNQ